MGPWRVPKRWGLRFLVSVPSVQRHLRGAALLHGSAGSRTQPVPSLQPQICFDQMETRSSTENYPVTRRIIISLFSMTSSLLLSTDNQRGLGRAGCLDSGSRPAGQWHRLLSTDQKRNELQSAGGLKDQGLTQLQPLQRGGARHWEHRQRPSLAAFPLDPMEQSPEQTSKAALPSLAGTVLSLRMPLLFPAAQTSQTCLNDPVFS